ncbi:MAG TPA: hypothetical protein VFV67_16085 [Actinophytocola sp.]|uniref:hypothetical protein n=1 Tax=Actinophytocola sp. TaxID=1872138 RepID=UPI002DB9F6D5|nr:hypothetical protein [Actinophytocola sp.]HEU5472173.1 hypothetical protein [Actinophytocola sp.]
MNEVREMIAKALAGEPPLRIDYDAVRTSGRRRQARRHLGIAGAAALSVVAVVGAAVTVSQFGAGPATDDPADPASDTVVSAPSSTAPGPSVSCADLPVPPGALGRAAQAGPASAEDELQAVRLSEAFSRATLPLPPGVSAEPERPPLCPTSSGSWSTRFTLRSPAGDRGVFLSLVRSRAPGYRDCTLLATAVDCRVSTAADGTTVRILVTPPDRPDVPVRVEAAGWRPDGTAVSVLETGAPGDNPAPRILDDDALTRILTLPELGLSRSAPASTTTSAPVSLPQAPSQRMADRLTATLTTGTVVPSGMRAVQVPQARVPALAFFVSQGGYKLTADLVDSQGAGNLFIELSPPAPDGMAPRCFGPDCEAITLPDGRPGVLARTIDGQVVTLTLNTVSPTGTQVSIMSRNRSAVGEQKSAGPTRRTPPLGRDELIGIAINPGQHW